MLRPGWIWSGSRTSEGGLLTAVWSGGTTPTRAAGTLLPGQTAQIFRRAIQQRAAKALKISGRRRQANTPAPAEPAGEAVAISLYAASPRLWQ
jgi:hypothetical protein